MISPPKHQGRQGWWKIRDFPRWMLVLVAISMLVSATDRVNADDELRRAVMGRIFTNDDIKMNVRHVLKQATGLPDEQRFDLLANWVLPGPNHAALRVHVEFEATDEFPASVFDSPQNSPQYTAPILELVSVAKKLNRLPEVRQRIDAATQSSFTNQLNRLAGLTVADAALDDHAAAAEHLTQIYKMVAEEPTPEKWWRSPLLLAVSAGRLHPETRGVSRDLVLQFLRNRMDDLESAHVYGHDRHLLAIAEQIRLLSAPTNEENDAPKIPKASMMTVNVARSPELAGPVRPLTQWQQATLATFATQADGNPPVSWHWDGSTVHNGAGHSKDLLYFQSPLRGDYEVEFDTSAMDKRNLHLNVGGHWAGGIEKPERFLMGTLTDPFFQQVDLNTRMTAVRNRIHQRVVVRDNRVTWYGNGREFISHPLRDDHDPWIAFGRIVKNVGQLWDVRVTGAPTIPDSICLSSSPDLIGWYSYYGESVGGRPEQRRRWRHDGSSETGGVISSSRLSGLQPAAGWTDECPAESLLYYHRPMLEDGTIEFEFLYRQEDHATHPALGPLVFLLQPDGVKLHHVTNGRLEYRDLSPDNAITELACRRGPEKLPLREDEWNFVRLELNGDTVDLYLNDQHIYQRPLSAGRRRHFGLFHFADRHRAYVHNVVWRGDWPKLLPAAEQQELAADDVDFLDAALPKLTAVRQHTFGPKSLFTSGFRVAANAFTPTEDGMLVQQQGAGRYVNSSLRSGFSLSGDFDITTRFEQFQTAPAEGGTCNVVMRVVLADEVSSECNLRRRHNDYTGNQADKQLIYTDIVTRDEDGDRRGAIGQFPQECDSGTLRIARRGNKIYTLCAEGDSEHFRLVASTKFPTADVEYIGLRTLTFGESSLSVRFHDVAVRAEKIFTPVDLEIPSQDLIPELNANRDQLPNHVAFDFTKTAPKETDFFRWGIVSPWSPQDGGIPMIHEGQERWGASGMSLRREIAGDFDISFTTDLQQIIGADIGKDSVIYLKITFADEDKSEADVTFQQIGPNLRRFKARTVKQVGGQKKYRDVGSLTTSDVHSLRLARYGTKAYFFGRQSADTKEQLFGIADITDAPIANRMFAYMLHTGGEGRETHTLLKTMNVRAQSINSPAPAPPTIRTPPRSIPPRPRGLLDSLFDALK